MTSKTFPFDNFFINFSPLFCHNPYQNYRKEYESLEKKDVEKKFLKNLLISESIFFRVHEKYKKFLTKKVTNID